MKRLIFIGLSVLFSAAQAFSACPTGTTDLGIVQGKNACGLSGNYQSDLVLTADKIWVLQGGVFIGGDNKNNATITLQPGTKVIGQSGADYLVITRGSKIIANGTKSAPIVFSTAKTTNRTRGMWGGLVINGNAPINSCKTTSATCEAEGEGSTGLYGGKNEEDSSGVLKYVRVEYAGYEITPENELNGIAFQGVGRGTIVDYIQVHMNADDGVEFFGGTVNVKHVVLTGNKDDSMDWTSGWQGKAQFVIVQQMGGDGNNGIEGDNLKSPMNAAPRSLPELANMTFVGTTDASAKGGSALLLRRGSGVNVYNSVFTGFKRGCLDIDDNETFRNASNGGMIFENNIISCASNFQVDADDVFSVEDFYRNEGIANITVDPKLAGWAPLANSPLLVNEDITPLDLFFDEVDYIGAVKDQKDTWYEGWINLDVN